MSDELVVIGSAVSAALVFITGIIGGAVVWLWGKLEPHVRGTITALDKLADGLKEVRNTTVYVAKSQKRVETSMDAIHSALIVATESHRRGETETGIQMARAILERRKGQRSAEVEEVVNLLKERMSQNPPEAPQLADDDEWITGDLVE
jgi:hypothetical protein